MAGLATLPQELNHDVVDLLNRKDLDPMAVVLEPIPPVVCNGENGAVKKMKTGENGEREIVLGRNIHSSCFDVTEPEDNDGVTGDKEAYMAGVLARYRQSLLERTKHHLGYPYNLDFDYGALSQLQHFSINNLGDPFIESNYGVHSRQFEVGVLDWFARLWEIEKDQYWGYITNCGTEGNLHGILVGREVFPDGILYASKESHYSIFKAARMYRMDCVKIETLSSGEVDCDDFRAKLLQNKDKPAIINVNIGTTVKGAVDDLDLVIQTLEECGFPHNRFYIHCDGALFGLMLPFVTRAPQVTFKKPIGSVSVSGHKFVGCPMPCGVQITRMEHINTLSSNVEYLASRDATIMGSRNGHAPLFLWCTLNRKGYRGFQKEVQKCLRNAHYLKDRLRDAGISVMLNELSSTVVFELLPPPPPPPQSSHDETPEIVDEQPETTTNVGPSGNKEAVASKGNDPSRVSRSGEVADLEDILKQKTFTRSEIDHLTALLKSRTVDNLVENEKGSSEPNSSDEKAFHNRCEILTNYPANENGAERVLPAAITTPVTRSKVLEDVVASPAELAKAYMGSRPTRASPSVPREDLSASYNPFFQPKSPATSLIQKPANEIGAAANGFMTPRYRGRSAIYSMARTPYSRPHPTEVFKAAETSYGAHGASSSSHNATEIQQLSGSNRQVLKRRSSALESDIGFVGPIRRIRQKPNLLHYKALSQPVSGATHVKQGSGFLTDATEVPSSINGSANLRSSKALVDNDMHNTRYKSVPPQSIETARKIFQQLDKFSSKGKSPEKKFDIVGGSSSGKMATDMRDGLARKSMNTDSLKVLQTIEDSRKESGLVDSSNAPDQSLQISQRVEGSFHKSVPSVEEGEEAGRPTKALDFKNPRSNYDHPQKKRAFQMSAHEDYLELDDDVHANGVASTPFVKGVEDHELAKNSASISDNPQSVAISAGSPLAPELKSSTISSGSIKESPTDGFAAAQTFSGFSVPIGFSASLSTSTSTQAAVSYPLSTAEMNNVAGQTEKINDIIATSSNSASAKDIKSELPSSATEADGPDTVKKNTLHFGDVSKRMEGDPSSVANSAKGLFSFGTQSNGATLSNGLSSTLSGTMGVSSPVQTSSSSNDQVTVPVSVSSSPSPSLSVSNGNAVSTFSSVTSAGTMFSSATTGGLLNFGSSSSQFSTSTSAPSAFGSSFQFGSSAVLSTSASALESIAGPKSSETAVSNSIGGLFSVKPVETATVGNTISEFNASTSKSASGETQTAPPAFFSSASSSAVAFSSSTPNFSSQSASSPSSNIFGFSAPPSVNGSASVSIGSNHFTTGSGFVSSVGFPSVTAPVSSSSNTSSTIFGLQSSKPATSGSMFGSSSQITGFNFGSTASGTSGASNSTLIFGATSSSSAASISTPLVFGATSSTSAASNSNPNVFVAISSSPAANSGVFSFGAGSSTASVFSVPSAAASTSALSTTFSSQPAFASSTSPFAFGLTPPAGINDRMSMEDSMAEDSVQVSTPAAPVFGQPISAPSSNFVFNGAAAPSAGSPFQFSGQQNQFAPQNTPFQPSGSLEFNAGGAGSFSLGSGGVDKASRRIVKVKKQIRRK